MNVELYINNRQVELDDQFNVSLDKEFYDAVNLTTKEVSYSYSINIPTTQHNREIFDYVDIEETPNKFGQVYQTQLYVNSTLILDGNYVNEEIDGDYYTGNLYVPSQKNLKDIFGELDMVNIISHELYISRWNDIKEINWNMTNSNTDKHICFPFILYNIPYNSDAVSDKYTQYASYEDGANWDLDYMIPAFNITSVIKDIFKTFNMNVDGNIFNDEKFNKLYMTYSGEYDKFKNAKIVPYNCQLNMNYMVRRNENNDSTIIQVNGLDTLRFLAGDISVSENTTVTGIQDDYNMIVKSTTKTTGQIKVPKSGWYRISASGNYQMDGSRNNIWNQNGRWSVSGAYSSYDNSSDATHRPVEIQIIRGKSAAVTAPKPIGVYGFAPSQPNTDAGQGQSWSALNGRGVEIQYPQGATRFPKNNNTLLISDGTADTPTDDFICGAHFGHYGIERGGKSGESNKRGAFLYNNPDPTKTNASIQASSSWYQMPDNPENYTYDYKQANVLVRRSGKDVRAFSNCQAYNELNIYTPSGDDQENWIKSWNTSTNYNQISYNGLSDSTATTTGVRDGNFKCETVIWLNAGEYIDTFLICPLHNHGRWRGGFKRTYDRRGDTMPQTSVNVSIKMAIINSDPDWNYTKETIPSFAELSQNRKSNVNKMLPDIKVNDFLNGFVDTFNLKLSRLNSNSYSIDVTNENDTIGEIIDIEPYTDISRNRYTRIDLPSEYQFIFTVEHEEEGYTQLGTNNLKPEQYTGEGVYVNPASTNGSIIKKESIFSYCWYKDILFKAYNIEVLTPTPIISNNEVWDAGTTYAEAFEKGLYTDYSPRLFYPDTDNIWKYTIYPLNNQDATDIRLVPVTNNISPDNTLELSYDKYISNSIINKMFNVKLSTGHEVECNLYLPNYLFNKINNSSRIKMNNDLYQVKQIQQFDPLEENETKLILIKE